MNALPFLHSLFVALFAFCMHTRCLNSNLTQCFLCLFVFDFFPCTFFVCSAPPVIVFGNTHTHARRPSSNNSKPNWNRLNRRARQHRHRRPSMRMPRPRRPTVVRQLSAPSHAQKRKTRKPPPQRRPHRSQPRPSAVPRLRKPAPQQRTDKPF